MWLKARKLVRKLSQKVRGFGALPRARLSGRSQPVAPAKGGLMAAGTCAKLWPLLRIREKNALASSKCRSTGGILAVPAWAWNAGQQEGIWEAKQPVLNWVLVELWASPTG